MSGKQSSYAAHRNRFSRKLCVIDCVSKTIVGLWCDKWFLLYSCILQSGSVELLYIDSENIYIYICDSMLCCLACRLHWWIIYVFSLCVIIFVVFWWFYIDLCMSSLAMKLYCLFLNSSFQSIISIVLDENYSRLNEYEFFNWMNVALNNPMKHHSMQLELHALAFFRRWIYLQFFLCINK